MENFFEVFIILYNKLILGNRWNINRCLQRNLNSIKKMKGNFTKGGRQWIYLGSVPFSNLGITTTVENKLMQVIVLKEGKILESKCDMCNLKILNQSIQILKAVMFNVQINAGIHQTLLVCYLWSDLLGEIKIRYILCMSSPSLSQIMSTSWSNLPKYIYHISKKIYSGRSRGGLPLIFRLNWDPKSRKFFLGNRPPPHPLLRVWMAEPPRFSQGLDLALI